MRRQSRPPTEKRRLLMHRPVILRFFSRSFRRVKNSTRHVKRPWYVSPAPPAPPPRVSAPEPTPEPDLALFSAPRARCPPRSCRLNAALSFMMWYDAANTAPPSCAQHMQAL